MLIDLIAGARPNFMKVAPLIRALEARAAAGGPLRYRLVHTGQHYDPRLSGAFFAQLGIPEPDVNLEVGSGTQAEQTAAIMTRYERLLLDAPSRLCLVVGDVTSTMACAIAAQKLGCIRARRRSSPNPWAIKPCRPSGREAGIQCQGRQPIHFILLGDAARKEALKAQAAKMGLANVHFLDSVPKAEVPRYWSLLDVAIIHLRQADNFTQVIPSKLFECMGMGIPPSGSWTLRPMGVMPRATGKRASSCCLVAEASLGG
jgi:hypothetical protein